MFHSPDDFDFDLPKDLIAQFPAPERTASRLLLPGQRGMRDACFRDLPTLLDPGDLLVFNETRVVKARLFGHKDTGGRVELLIERVVEPLVALAHIRANHSPRTGSRLILDGGASATVSARQFGLHLLAFADCESVFDLMERDGALPLPPYIEHAPTASDEARYQTVYARNPGAVAAPTAGLHFDAPLLSSLRKQGIETAFLTLHVGAGTFQPMRVRDIADHVMHSERYDIPAATVESVERARNAGKRVIAVGTTSLRALEASALRAPAGRTLAAGAGDTNIFITPGFRFRVADHLITNFHLPKSTLMMLVAAFSGHQLVRSAYDHAIARRYRFFSYGDAMLLARCAPTLPAPTAPMRPANTEL